MYNLRYHIASLVAVFLALALGLVLGGLVVRQGGFDSQQRALVSSLQKEFNRLKANNATLKTDLSLEKAYSSQMTDAWVAGRMNGDTVLVLTSGDKNEGLDSVTAAVKSAGGKVAVATLLQPGFGLGQAEIASATASLVGTSTDAQGVAARRLADEWSQPGSTRPLSDALVQAGVLTLDGLAPTDVAKQMVDIAAFDRKPDTASLDIAQAYAATGLYALGAQNRVSTSGVAAAAASRGLSAFDTLGTNAGRFTLVALFTGGQQGYWGTAPKVTGKFPPVPSP
jgi:hypothetical protein